MELKAGWSLIFPVDLVSVLLFPRAVTVAGESDRAGLQPLGWIDGIDPQGSVSFPGDLLKKLLMFLFHFRPLITSCCSLHVSQQHLEECGHWSSDTFLGNQTPDNT